MELDTLSEELGIVEYYLATYLEVRWAAHEYTRS